MGVGWGKEGGGGGEETTLRNTSMNSSEKQSTSLNKSNFQLSLRSRKATGRDISNSDALGFVVVVKY